MPLAASEPAIYVRVQPQTYALRYGYIVARNDTTQQSGQTPDKEAEIKNIIFLSAVTLKPIRLECYFPDCLAPSK